MPTLPTNEKEIAKIQAVADARVDYWHPTMKGLGLRVSEARRTWMYMYRHAGRKVRYTFGAWPSLTLEAASKIVKDDLAPAVAQGKHPSMMKRAARDQGDFKALCESFREGFLNDDEKCRPSTRKEWGRMLTRLEERWGSSRPTTDEMGRAQLKPYFKVLKIENGPVMANRYFSLMRRVFSWAISEEIIEWTPFVNFDKPASEESRTRALTLKEIQAVLEAAQQERPIIQTMWSMFFETLARRTEVCSARWDAINWEEKVWTFRGKGKGKGKLHTLPLSTQQMERLRALQQLTGNTPYIFASPHTHLDKDGSPAPIVHVGKVLDRVRKATGISDFRLHDIRRTGATRMAELFNVPDGIIASILNHSKKLDNDAPDITAIYQRARKLGPMREAVQQWANWLEGVSNGTIKVGTVTPISQAASQ